MKSNYNFINKFNYNLYLFAAYILIRLHNKPVSYTNGHSMLLILKTFSKSAVVWSAVYDCVIAWSYSITFCYLFDFVTLILQSVDFYYQLCISIYLLWFAQDLMAMIHLFVCKH